jgi:hypothetical protein
MHSTLEPLSQAFRLAVETGNIDFAFYNFAVYLLKSFGSGKNIRVLFDELFIGVRQLGNHLGNDSSFKTPSYKLFLQFFVTPFHNVLREYEGDSVAQDTSFPFDQVQLVENYSVLKTAVELNRFFFVLVILMAQTPYEFMTRNMESALKCSSMYVENFLVGVSRALARNVCVHMNQYDLLKPTPFSSIIVQIYFRTGQGDDDAKWISNVRIFRWTY